MLPVCGPILRPPVTAQRTNEVLHRWDDLATVGLTSSQTLKDIKLTIQHSFMAEHSSGVHFPESPCSTQQGNRRLRLVPVLNPCFVPQSGFVPSPASASLALTPVSQCIHRWPLLGHCPLSSTWLLQTVLGHRVWGAATPPPLPILPCHDGPRYQPAQEDQWAVCFPPPHEIDLYPPGTPHPSQKLPGQACTTGQLPH